MTLPYTQLWLIWEPRPAPRCSRPSIDCKSVRPRRTCQSFSWGMPYLLEDPGPKIKDGAILDRVLHLYWIAADFTVFDIGLSCDRRVEHHGDFLPAVWTREEVLHQR